MEFSLISERGRPALRIPARSSAEAGRSLAGREGGWNPQQPSTWRCPRSADASFSPQASSPTSTSL